MLVRSPSQSTREKDECLSQRSTKPKFHVGGNRWKTRKEEKAQGRITEDDYDSWRMKQFA